MVDAHELLGQPVVANGIALSKIHHASLRQPPDRHRPRWSGARLGAAADAPRWPAPGAEPEGLRGSLDPAREGKALRPRPRPARRPIRAVQARGVAGSRSRCNQLHRNPPCVGSGSGSVALRHPMGLERRAFPQRSGLLVQLEPRLLKVPDDPLGELVPGVVGRVLLQEPAQQAAAAGQAKPIEKTRCCRNDQGCTRATSCSRSVLSARGKPICQLGLSAPRGGICGRSVSSIVGVRLVLRLGIITGWDGVLHQVEKRPAEPHQRAVRWVRVIRAPAPRRRPVRLQGAARHGPVCVPDHLPRPAELAERAPRHWGASLVP
jgi:hypothetical protein